LVCLKNRKEIKIKEMLCTERVFYKNVEEISKTYIIENLVGHSKVIGIYERGSDSDFKTSLLELHGKWVEKNGSWELRWKHGDQL